MKSHRHVIAPILPNHIIEADDALVKSVISVALMVQQKLQAALEKDYAKPLEQDHQPDMLDPHKTRHMQKSNMAKLLNQACQARLHSLRDVKKFINLFKQCESLNQKIDTKGGVFGRILGTCSYDISELDTSIYTTERSISNCQEYMLTILNHMQARVLAPTDSRAFNYHSEEIARFTGLLHNEYQQTFSTLTGINDRDTLEQITQRKMDEFQATLNDVMFEYSYLDSSNKNERERHLIDMQKLPYLVRLDSSEEERLQTASADTVKLYLASKAILALFVGHLKFSEKELILQCQQAHEADTSTRLFPQEFERKATWFRCSLEEKIVDLNPKERKSAVESFLQMTSQMSAREEEDIDRIIAQETGRRFFKPKASKPQHVHQYVSYQNPLHTNELMMNLKDLLSDTLPLDVNSLIHKLDERLAYHFKHELTDSLLEYELRSILREWKARLKSIFEQLKLELVNAEKLLHGIPVDDEGLQTETTRRITDLILHPVPPAAIYAAASTGVPAPIAPPKSTSVVEQNSDDQNSHLQSVDHSRADSPSMH